MFCTLLVASIFCFQPAPIVCEQILYDKKATFTAYTLSEDETDGNPEIGAGNHNLKEYVERGTRVCASRLYALHTRIYIEGIGQCEILDRTSVKYSGRIDILFETKKEAFKFGKRELEYRVLTP